MDFESENELERIRKLDKIRKLCQSILGNHLLLLIISFLLILSAISIFVLVSISYSPSQYLARLTLCFNPKQKGKIGQYDDRYMLRILNRQTVRLNFIRQKNMRQKRKRLDNIQVTLNPKQPHFFAIQLYASNEADAVDMINEFAKVCIQEYSRERSQDLKKWKSILEEEREEYFKQIQQLNSQIAELTVPLQVISPEKDFERLRTRLSELQTARNRLNVVLENLKRREMQFEKELSSINPTILIHQQVIKAFFADLKRLDHEIAQATELYTDENPKMIAMVSRRNGAQKRLDDFLKSKEIDSVDPQTISRLEKLSAELKTVQGERDDKKNELQVLDGEIADCQKRFRMLSDYQPRLHHLMQQRKNLQESMHRLEESISEINYILLTVNDDLFVSENAQYAVKDKAFTKKVLAVCAFAALVVLIFLAAMIVLVEFFFGRVASAYELLLYDEFHYLGVLPVSANLFTSDDQKKMVFNKIYHKFQALKLHTIFTGAMVGAKIIDELFDFFKWNFAMCGHRMLIIDMVLAEEFDLPPDADADTPTAIVTFSGGKCYLPLASKKFLAPSELELLKNDFEQLQKNYEYIFIRHSFTMRRSLLFLEQIAELTDGAMLAIGADRTPRKNLRQLLALQQRINLPVMTLLTYHSADKLNKDLNQEAES